jgi:DNA polymerase-1
VDGYLSELPDWLRDCSYDRFYSDNYVVIDFETTVLDKGSPYNLDNKVVCSSWRYGKDHPDYTPTTQVHIGNEYQQHGLIDAIDKADFFVAHNSKFEYGWLERCGLELQLALGFCTQIAEYVLLSNKSNPQMLSLEKCLMRRKMPQKTPLGKALLKIAMCPSEWPRRWLIPYSAQDVDAGELLFLDQRKQLIKRDQLKTLFTRCLLTPVLVDIERRGMHIDESRVRPIHADYTEQLHILEDKIAGLVGGANPNSPKQMIKVLYEDLKFPLPKDDKWYGKPDKDGNKQPTTSFDYIGTVKATNAKQRKFMALKQEYSKVNAALTKCLNKFVSCCDETTDHIITASLNQTITATQRLSSTGRNYKAQFQNFPRIFKPLFSSRQEGWEMGEIDYAQLEYRVAVWFGQDEAGLYDINHSVDSHAFTADKIFGDRFTSLSKEDPERSEFRTAAKAHTFKPLYGGESGSRDEVRYYKAFKAKHKGVTAIQEDWKMEALNTGKVSCPNGLKFHFPGTTITRSGYVTNSTNICNYNVQSFATADIVPMGLVYTWHLFRIAGLASYIVNTVHDSIITEVFSEEKEIIKEIGELSCIKLVKVYLRKIYNVDFNVPLAVDIEFAKNWHDSDDWINKYLEKDE